MKQYFVKDGSRNCFIAEATLKDGSSIFLNKKNEENTENAVEEHAWLLARRTQPAMTKLWSIRFESCTWSRHCKSVNL